MFSFSWCSNSSVTQLMPPAAAREKEGSNLGITCPPDRVPQTPAGGLRPPAPPTEELPCETCIGRMGRERSEEYIPMDLMDKLASVAQRYEELNRLMAQPEVLEDLSLLQRY